MRAHEAFDALIRRSVAPELKGAGFKRCGRAFFREECGHWGLIGVQCSQFRDVSEVRFTLNFQVIEESAYAAFRAMHPRLGEIPRANTFLGDAAWHCRPGVFLPGENVDHWWTIDEYTDLDALAEGIVALIRERALPEMFKRMGSRST